MIEITIKNKDNSLFFKIFTYLFLICFIFLISKFLFLDIKNNNNILEGAIYHPAEKIANIPIQTTKILPGYIKQTYLLENEKKINCKLSEPLSDFLAKELIENTSKRMEHLKSRVSGVTFKIYKIKINDNLWKIADANRCSINSIIGCNPQLTTYDVKKGQLLLIPSREGIIHQIQNNDSWAKIAVRYNIAIYNLLAKNAGVCSLTPGEMIFAENCSPDINLMNEKIANTYKIKKLFIFPINNKITSWFGKRKNPFRNIYSFHSGIDIAAKINTPVMAAGDGIVTAVGWKNKIYGNIIFIKHENGFETQYGHLAKIYVRKGQKVKARQIIAVSGASGRVTGPHLHFTVKKDNTLKNPLEYLIS